MCSTYFFNLINITVCYKTNMAKNIIHNMVIKTFKNFIEKKNYKTLWMATELCKQRKNSPDFH